MTNLRGGFKLHALGGEQRDEGSSLKSFTLIELLVVIAIIAILAGMLLPALSKVKETGRGAVCNSNQKQLSTVIQQYASAYGDALLPQKLSDGSATVAWYDYNGWLRKQVVPGEIEANWVAGESFIGCPSRSERWRTSDASYLTRGWKPRFWSYAHNTLVMGAGAADGANKYYMLTKIRRPSHLVGFCDSEMWGLGTTASLRMCPEKGNSQVDFLSFRHNGRMGISCLDGHVETITGRTELISSSDSTYLPIDMRFDPRHFTYRSDGEPAYK